MKSALTFVAIAGLTMGASLTHHGEDSHAIKKGPTPNDKPVVHWGEHSYADAAKKGAKLALFKLHHHHGENHHVKKAGKRGGHKGMKKHHHHGENHHAKHGKAGHKGMRKHHNHGEDHHHGKKHAKLALFKLGAHNGEEGTFATYKKMLGQKLAGLKHNLHHLGEAGAMRVRNFGKRVGAGMRKLHNHGEESHVVKAAKLSLYKKIARGGEDVAKKTKKTRKNKMNKKVHNGEDAHKKTKKTRKNKRVNHGEDSHKKTKKTKKVATTTTKTVAKPTANVVHPPSAVGTKAPNGSTIVNRGAWAFFKKSKTVNGEDVARRLKRNAKKTAKKAKRVHGGETGHKGRNPLSKRNKRHARKHAGEDSNKKVAKKTKKVAAKPAALGLYELSSLLNLNQA